MMRVLVATFVAAAVLAAGTARAEYLYQFDKPNYTVPLGGTVDVSVYIAETGTTNLTTYGLAAADFSVGWTGTSAAVTSVAEASPFGLFSKSIGSASAELNVMAPLTGAVKASPVLLGTFTFSASPTVTGVTMIATFDPYPEFEGDVALGPTAYTSLDPLLTNATATITIIPEPSTLVMLLGLGATLGALYFGRLRRSSKTR